VKNAGVEDVSLVVDDNGGEFLKGDFAPIEAADDDENGGDVDPTPPNPAATRAYCATTDDTPVANIACTADWIVVEDDEDEDE
jgi:hypothetical protein